MYKKPIKDTLKDHVLECFHSFLGKWHWSIEMQYRTSVQFSLLHHFIAPYLSSRICFSTLCFTNVPPKIISNILMEIEVNIVWSALCKHLFFVDVVHFFRGPHCDNGMNTLKSQLSDHLFEDVEGVGTVLILDSGFPMFPIYRNL